MESEYTMNDQNEETTDSFVPYYLFEEVPEYNPRNEI